MRIKSTKSIPKRMKDTNERKKTHLSKKNNKKEANKPKKRYEKKVNKIRKIIFIILFIAFLICAGYFAYDMYIGLKDKSVLRDVQKYMGIEENTQDYSKQIERVGKLQEENSDIIGWIQIEKTKINYPILQNEDNNYYLNCDYRKNKNRYGSIYLKNICNINDEYSNLVIYGHDMKDGEMFNNLLKYKDEKYYKEHNTVKIITEKEKRDYKILSVFKSRVFYKNEKNVFRYYNEVNFENEEQYNQYIENAKKEELYDTGITAKYGEQLITMVTCEYSQNNGRMVVVAKREK